MRAFSTLVGVPAAELAGKTLAELVSAEYAELVALAVTRVLAGEANPALTEVEVADSHGQVTRLELTGSAIDSAGRKLVLFTAEEMLPHHEGEGAGLPPARSQLALDSLGEGLLTTDAHGLIDYLNPSAETLTGIRREDAVGQAFSAMIGFVDEHDRRALADPVQQCLATGSRVNLGRRSILISRATGSELGVEATASPIRGPDGDVSGVAVMLHDVSELRGLTQQMSYQASHDALTGLVNRREFERRLGEALEIARAGRQGHVMCYLDLDRFKAVNDTSGHLAGDNMLREVAVAHPRGGPRFGHGRAPRRRRVRRAARRLPAREGAPDRRRRPARDRRVSLHLEGPDLQRRRQHRHRGAHGREQLARGDPERRGFGLLRRQEAGRQPRARLFVAR